MAARFADSQLRQTFDKCFNTVMPALRTLLLLSVFLSAGLCLTLLPGCNRESASSGIHFTDVAEQAGLHYVFTAGVKGGSTAPALTILQTIGNGCAFLDYNNDGSLDILLVGPKLALYKGDGRGKFTDATHETGIDKPRGHFLGCAVGDYDNDGFDDVYISGYRTGILLRNVKGKGFLDVTGDAGMKPQPWGTSCGWADLNGDGRLDLFVANYVQFGPDPKRYPQTCEPLACGPQQYRPERPTLYQNLGGGRFADISAASGLRAASGKGLGVAFADSEGDGRQDILVANDQMAGDLFRNDGQMRFTNVGVASGTAFGPDGRLQGGMGADWADYDGDGRLDAIVTTYQDQPKSLYHNDSDGLFRYVSQTVGIADPSKPFVAFGVKWLDYDNDGWPDILIANGNVDNHISVMFPDQHYRQTSVALHNVGGNRFINESNALGPALQKPIIGRGLATGDFDNDGRADALIVDSEGPPLLLHNQGAPVGNWIGFSLTGTGKSNRDALGARVTVEAGGRRQVKEAQTAGSYLSSSDRRLLFGLGTAKHIDRVTIRWPDGRTEALPPLATGQYHAVTEGRPGI